MLRPKGVSVHYEVELGLVIGKTVRDLDPEDEQGALDAIQSELEFSSQIRAPLTLPFRLHPRY